MNLHWPTTGDTLVKKCGLGIFKHFKYSTTVRPGLMGGITFV